MRATSTSFLALLALTTAVGSGSALGQDADETTPAEADHEPTYTDAELAALDRALAAGNLSRADLEFDKALTDGHAAFPVVLRMLREPLTIAPTMDAMARAVAPGDSLGTLLAAHDWTTTEVVGTTPWTVTPSLELPTDTESLVAFATSLVVDPPVLTLDSDPAENALLLDVLRERLPESMAWHDEFPSPLSAERRDAVEARMEAEGASFLQDTAARVDVGALVGWWRDRWGEPTVWLYLLPIDAFPTDEPLIVETPHGRIGLGTPGDDTWTGEFAVLIDPAGDDRYVDCRVGAATGVDGRRVGLFADLAGDDLHDARTTELSLGAAVLGVAAAYDLGAGDDRYFVGHGTLGAAMGGVAVFQDDGGTDVYEGRTYTQGAAGWGLGVFLDGAAQPEPETSSDEGTAEPVDVGLFDNDTLTAWANAQAFARPGGVAICRNERGNDVYRAGGVYLHAPLFADRYQSFSQGFAIGARGEDYAGGIALLLDGDGNDRYLGDIYDQGAGYWYGAGLLWDGGGNDTYEMTQYGQGSGIHLAVGGLVDVAGHDTYVMHSGLGQGGSHDYAASILHDRAGNDRYHGSTSCNGCGLTNSVGIQIDREGDDTYAGRRKSGVNFGRPARDFPSIGLLLDLEGTDDYLGRMADGEVWRHTDIGLGVDVRAADETGGGGTPAADQVHGEAEIPAVCSYEGELTQEVFDELWEIAVRWEVGDNRIVVPEARKRLVAFGPPVVPLLHAKVPESHSSLALRGYQGVLAGLRDAGHEEAAVGFLRDQVTSEDSTRVGLGLWLVTELRTESLAGAVVEVLGGDDTALARRAAAALAGIGSDAGNDVLVGWLRDGSDGRLVAAAISTVVALEAPVYDELRPYLDHDDFGLRMRLVTLLGRSVAPYRERLVADLATAATSVRVRRCVLDVLTRARLAPTEGELSAVAALLGDADPGLRADAARLVRAWEGLDEPVGGLGALLGIVDRLATDDPDAFVRSAASSR